MPFGVQLEFLEFEKIAADTSKLNMRVIYESAAHRDRMLKMPFARGLNTAHDQLQDIASNLK